MRYPKLRRHSTGCGTVRLNGQDFYFSGTWPKGRKAPPGVQAQYEAKIAEWLAQGCQPKPAAGILVEELAGRFLDHVAVYYRKNGKPTSELTVVRNAVVELRRRHGRLDAAQFDGTMMQQIVDAWIERGLSRNTINTYTHKLKLMFRWAARPPQKLVPPSVIAELDLVPLLRMGRTLARETPPVRPPTLADLERVLALARPWERSMLELHFLTGMRPGELVALHAGEIDQSVEPWPYRPASHKTEHHGRGRLIFFGPRARQILAPVLAQHPGGYLFPNPAARYREYMTVSQYWLHVQTLCDRAGVPAFRPNALRHYGLTEARLAGGLEAAQATAGHASQQMTMRYVWTAEERLAREMAERIG